MSSTIITYGQDHHYVSRHPQLSSHFCSLDALIWNPKKAIWVQPYPNNAECQAREFNLA